MLVPEVPLACPDERHAGSVRDCDHLVVADRAARGDRGGDAGSGGDSESVEEREVSVRGQDTAPRPLAGPLDCETNARNPVWLAGAHPRHRIVFSKDDSVRLDVLAGAPGEAQVAQLFR